MRGSVRLAPPRTRLRTAYRLFRSHDPRRSWKRPAQANSSRIGVFKRTLKGVSLNVDNQPLASRVVDRLADGIALVVVTGARKGEQLGFKVEIGRAHV